MQHDPSVVSNSGCRPFGTKLKRKGLRVLYVYGTTLRIPGESPTPSPNDKSADLQTFLEEFHQHMKQIKSIPVRHHFKKSIFLYKDLAHCAHVFLSLTMNKISLEQPYTGPHEVLESITDRVFKTDVNGVPHNIFV